ncbi:hypothetical protein [Bacillus aerolatus]|uniref:hypothetical protein n=1 Tax=Bacillus aerolatus TaxID=2653354 RepID=UPI00177CC28B|nr:hypothetical protein [Bacillus aerolatus]
MNKKQTEKNQGEKLKKNPESGLYGMDAETSLQSVNFATTENSYLNEQFQEDSDE